MADLLRKIYRKLFPAPQPAKPAINLHKGPNTYIDPTSLLVTVDKGEIILEGNNYIGKSVELGTTGTIKIGDNTSLQDRCIILQDVEIGKGCVFAPNVYISSGRHYFDHKPNFYIKDQDAMVSGDPILSAQHSKKVTVGDDCWLGINAVVMSGVSIGRGCVVGANSVVTKDVEPFTVVAGIPAKEIKKRLNFEQKTSIQFDNENDLPNFYKGFLVDKKSLDANKPFGGIIAEAYFECYLSTEGKTIELELKGTGSTETKLIYNKQEKEITKEFTSVSFNLGAEPYHKFNLKGANSILVKRVTIKN